MKRSLLILLLASMLVSCVPPTSTPTPVSTRPTDTTTPLRPPTSTSTAMSTATLTPAPTSPVPGFEHVVLILFENKEFGSVIGNPDMPVYNRMANEYTLLTQFYAVRHPSLPNYIALIGGDTFGITSDCHDCFVNAPACQT